MIPRAVPVSGSFVLLAVQPCRSGLQGRGQTKLASQSSRLETRFTGEGSDETGTFYKANSKNVSLLPLQETHVPRPFILS